MNLIINVNVPNLVTCLNHTPIFQWYVVRCGSKNRYQKGIMCLKEIGLHVLDLIVNKIKGGTYMTI